MGKTRGRCLEKLREAWEEMRDGGGKEKDGEMRGYERGVDEG